MTGGRVKKGGVKKRFKECESSKRRRRASDSDDDSNDSDYLGETEAESSMGLNPSFEVDDDPLLHQGGMGLHADIIDTYSHTAPKKVWNSNEYATARHANAYAQERDTIDSFFHTQVQENAFFGHLVGTTVFSHKRIDFDYLASKAVLVDVAIKFEHLRLRPFLEHRCDWNDIIIKQFYATYEIDFDAKTLEWMTGKRKFSATFEEFAIANKLDYAYFTDQNESTNVYSQTVIENVQIFYEPAHVANAVLGISVGLRHHPAAINNILRATIMPKSGNKDKIRDYYWNVISYIMNGVRFDVVSLIFEQMIQKKYTLVGNMYFAPYIMSLIKAKTNFNGPCEQIHGIFQPFFNAIRTFLNRPLTPYEPVATNVVHEDAPIGEQEAHADAQGANVEGAAHNDEAPAMPPPPMQHQWVPVPGYFDPYFQNMQQGLSMHIDQGFQNMQQGFQGQFQAFGQQMQVTFQGQLDARFQAFGQQLRTDFYDPMMTRLQNVQEGLHTDIEALNDRFSDLTTSEEHQQLVDRQQQLETDFGIFSDTFTGFSNHFYSIYPAPVPPPEFYPHQPFYPPPPPQDD